jgi:hypothetical protein
VTAFTTAHNRIDADVERIVGRLSLEPTVSAALASPTPTAVGLWSSQELPAGVVELWR